LQVLSDPIFHSAPLAEVQRLTGRTDGSE
jgi:hypothetical protein